MENLDEADHFVLGIDFIRNFDVLIHLNDAMIRIRNLQSKYVIKPVKLITAKYDKDPVFLGRVESLRRCSNNFENEELK